MIEYTKKQKNELRMLWIVIGVLVIASYFFGVENIGKFLVGILPAYIGWKLGVWYFVKRKKD